MIDAFAKDGFDVFSGNEKPLIENIKSGGAGCISATANINPGKIAETYKTYATPEGEKLQAWINEVRGVMQGYVMIPALKYVHRALRQRRGLDAGPSAAGRSSTRRRART